VRGHPVLHPHAILKAPANRTLVRLEHHHWVYAKVNLGGSKMGNFSIYFLGVVCDNLGNLPPKKVI
jgi:hypothetical protein